MSDFFIMALQVVLVVIVPLVVNRIVKTLLRNLANDEFFQVPILATLARLQGILAGFLLIRLDFERQYFDIEQMFMPDGPWNLSMSQFLLERANVFVYNPQVIINLLPITTTWESMLASLVVVVIPLLLLVLSFMFWGSQDAIRAVVTSAGLAILSSWLTIYLVSATFWILHLINFWSLILLALYIQHGTDKRKSEGWWFWW